MKFRRASYLPHWVCVFAIFGRTSMDGFFFLHIVNSHTAIVETYSDHVWVFWMDIQAHHATVCFINVLRKGGIFHRKEQNHSTALLHEIICNEVRELLYIVVSGHFIYQIIAKYMISHYSHL